jgi:hypothetical protein
MVQSLRCQSICKFMDFMALNERVIDEWWIGNNMEGSGRGLIWGNIPAFMEGLRKLRKTSVRIPGLRAEIWTQNLPNTKHKC